jgi:hypothetical protein
MSVRKQERIENLFQDCINLANDVASPTGFVPVRKLVERLNAEVIFRSLLVEAMITVNSSPSEGCADWKILLDIDRFKRDSEIYPVESDDCKMSNRCRNTIAHELLHTFAFKQENNKFVPRLYEWQQQSGTKTVNYLEKEAENLSSVLLIPSESIFEFLNRNRHQLEFIHLLEWYRGYGVSREIFINRIKFLRNHMFDHALGYGCLKNIMIGIGQWSSSGEAQLNTWPVFANFEKNFAPQFLIESKRNRERSMKVTLPPEQFTQSLRDNSCATFSGFIGTEKFPESTRCKFTVEIEEVEKKPLTKFLFLMKAEVYSDRSDRQESFDDLLSILE